MPDLNNGLIGLAMLSGGTPAFAAGLSAPVESRAVRQAKAQFTLAPVTPPWKEPGSALPASTQLAAVRRLASLIDRPDAARGLPDDVSSAFITWKALDRLRVLAEGAAEPGATDATRRQLQASFAHGLGELQSFLASAPADRLTIAFGVAARRADSVAAGRSPVLELPGRAIVKLRSDALPGLGGTEVFTITLRSVTSLDRVTVDLSHGPQPPTLDSITAMLNAAIASIPRLTADGSVALDTGGDPIPKWRARFEAVRQENGWGLQLDSDVEQVAIEQQGAPDALVAASGRSTLEAPTATGIFRFDDPAGTLERRTVASLSALDPAASAEARLASIAGASVAPAAAPLLTAASVTDAQGFTYLVGTTPGDLGTNIGNGRGDLVLTKLGSDGGLVWQRSLGATDTAAGAAISLAPDGGVVVAGTVEGSFDGQSSDGDMLVVRFDEAGDERSATLIRSVGADSATAVTALGDGSVVVGGRSADGSALLARLDPDGRIAERRSIAGSIVRALGEDSGGRLLLLTQNGAAATLRRLDPAALGADLGTLDLGLIDAQALAVDGTSVAVGGHAAGDGLVLRIGPDLALAGTTSIASAGSDRVDSLAFVDGALFAGGRTDGVLGDARVGALDAFVARIDPADGSLGPVRQWGRAASRMEPVSLSVAAGGGGAVEALGFHQGWINPPDSERLVATTSLRPGDQLALRVDGGALRRVSIDAADTLSSLVDKLRKAAGANVPISAATTGDGRDLRIEVAPGHTVELLRGPDGRDALAKLGLEPARLTADAPLPSRAPRVRPGGHYSLELSAALNLSDAPSAALALDRIKAALSTSQTAFHSLYWDDNKAALVDGAGRGGRVSPYQAAQLARYRDALARLGA
ncbi:hypothetical protein HMF7854_07625 [Sphingomonas ginkgonis]|uniref:Regulatory protein FlaEY n=1 Tax=Sphingomonas ginkgonis TaxID=2315330 RepID=A0A3R9Y5U1_9SPHN|nr:hypothetical protein [Sphingomonas ginkgonis]RST30716.1 hypothetical protein HMF7854_07625 [Sphingomonas ginkgonis]